MKNLIGIKVLKPVTGLVVGQTYKVEADAKGVPLERKWRRALSNAKIDKGVELVALKESNKKPKPQKKQTKPETDAEE